MRGLFFTENIHIEDQVAHFNIDTETIGEQRTITRRQADSVTIVTGKPGTAEAAGNIEYRIECS